MTWLSVSDLCARWSCGRSSVYTAIRSMESAGYLRRLYVGRDQRISLEAVETWEKQHAQAPGSAPRAEVVALRLSKPTKMKAAAASTASISDRWRAMQRAV